MATKTNWQELYTDLSSSLAEKLREARVKPDKLKTMTDGEILSIKGVGDSALEKIRAAYPITSVEQTTKETKKEVEKEIKPAKTTTKKKKTTSKRYQALKKKVDTGKFYPLKDALELLVKLSAKRKTNTLELHLNTTDTGIKGEISLPHSTGKKQTIEIFNEKTIVKINAGKLDFDILLATPKDMPTLAKHAKVLGPRGLMPTPKNGNLIENPEKRLEELSKGATLAYKTESKFPLIHLNLGPITQKTKHLEENILSLLNHINPSKIKSAFLTTTQLPSVKLDLTSL